MTYLRQGIVRFLALALGAVLAAAVPASAQTIVEFSGLALPPQGITAGPDGNLWFTENSFDTTPRIGRLTVSGTLLETMDLGFGPFDIVAGPDGNLWFTDPDANTIGRVTP